MHRNEWKPIAALDGSRQTRGAKTCQITGMVGVDTSPQGLLATEHMALSWDVYLLYLSSSLPGRLYDREVY